MEILNESKIKMEIEYVKNGIEALKYLKKENGYEDVTTPDLVLLDLNMPKKDGREVLEDIKSNEELKTIPVVILTTSKDNQDIAKSYAEGASCYITKPPGLEEFKKVVSSLENFWFTIVKFPEEDR